jgi:hypothetical protein
MKRRVDDASGEPVVSKRVRLEENVYPMPCYLGAFDELIENASKELQRETNRKRLRPTLVNIRQKRLGESRVVGYDIVDKIRVMLDSFGEARSNDQRLFHEEFLKACLHKIFGKDFGSERDRLTRMFLGANETRFWYEVMIIAPRRFGKTWAVSMFATALALCVPGITVPIFSTGQRASTALLELCMRWIKRSGNSDRVVGFNKTERIIIDHGEDSENSVIASYPSSVEVSDRVARRLHFLVVRLRLRLHLFVVRLCLHFGFGFDFGMRCPARFGPTRRTLGHARSVAHPSRPATGREPLIC